MGVASTAMLVVAALFAIEWVIAYHRKTHGAWRKKTNPMSRHLMVFMAVIAAALSVSAAREIIVDILGDDGPTWFQIVRLVVLAAIPAVILWRRILLSRAHNDTLVPQR